MQPFQVDQLLRTFKRRPLRFSYFKDAYAMQLLAYASEETACVRALKRSRFGSLMAKPVVRKALASCADGVARPELFTQGLANQNRNAELDTLEYRLSLGRWGEPDAAYWDPDWDQTSRPGENLVLRLNFTRDHNRDYHALLKPLRRDAFTSGLHPNDGDLNTMSWARLDFDASEALIEEIQTDWIKFALRMAKSIAAGAPWAPGAAFAPHVDSDAILTYVACVLQPHVACWSEATLAAAIGFAKEHLGVRRIFYNTFEGGNWLKQLDGTKQPPRYLYSTLPRRFCFEKTRQRPRALSRERHHEVRERLTRRTLEWYLLEL